MVNIYWDVDGTINPFSGGPPKQNTQWFGEWSTKRIEDQPILWSHELIERINELGTMPDVRQVWLTDWMTLARDELAPQIGLHGPWEVLTGDLHAYPWWKLCALIEDLEKNPADKSVWLDDNLIYSKEVVAWLKEHPEVHWVKPVSNHGMTKKQIDGIIEFITT